MRSLLWDYTEECNLRCIHCYNEKNVSQRRRTLFSKENAETIFNRMKELEINHIHLLGGEPLLASNILEFINEAKKRNIKISINTNGTMLNDYMINALLDLNVDQLIISLDGVDVETNDSIRGKGVYDNVTHNIKKLVQAKKYRNADMIIQLATVITNMNVDRIGKIPLLAKELGVDVINIMPVAIRGSAVNNAALLEITPKQYYDVLKKLICYSYLVGIMLQIDCKSKVLEFIRQEIGFDKKRDSDCDKCQAGEKIIYMDVIGNIYPCGPLALTEFGKKVKVNIMEEDCFEKVSNFSNLISEQYGQAVVPEICKICDNRTSCDHGRCKCSTGHSMCEYIAENLSMTTIMNKSCDNSVELCGKEEEI